MKRLFTTLVTFAVLCLATCFQSCEKDAKYTVWTETATYDEFQTAFQKTLSDGHYIKIEIGQATWEEMAKNLTSEGRHRWDEATIKKWFISYGFGETEARRESSWLTIVDHGFVVVRNDNLVNMILK